MDTKQIYHFDRFILDSEQRVLAHDGRAVALQCKTFDLLLALVSQAGRTVTRAKLVEALWPDAFVDESNLTQQVALIRRALGDNNRPKQGRRYIRTVHRIGYMFVAPVAVMQSAQVEEIKVTTEAAGNPSGPDDSPGGVERGVESSKAEESRSSQRSGSRPGREPSPEGGEQAAGAAAPVGSVVVLGVASKGGQPNLLRDLASGPGNPGGRYLVVAPLSQLEEGEQKSVSTAPSSGWLALAELIKLLAERGHLYLVGAVGSGGCDSEVLSRILSLVQGVIGRAIPAATGK